MEPHEAYDFKHLFQDKDFLKVVSLGYGRVLIGRSGAIGTRLAFGFFCVEYYTTNEEPILDTWRGLRLVIWNPVTRVACPPSWSRAPFQSNSMVYAYIDIRDKGKYRSRLSTTFKRYLNIFSRQREYQIKEISYDRYLQMYSLYGEKTMITKMVDRVKSYYAISPKQMHFFGLESLASGCMVAGISGVDCVDVKQSYYISAFTRKDIAPPYAGFQLLNYWMEKSVEGGMSFANLGVVWTKGQPKSWKGFSDFKKKFNPHYLVLPREFLRWTFSLK